MTPQPSELPLMPRWAKKLLNLVCSLVVVSAGAAVAWGGTALLYSRAFIDWDSPDIRWITVTLFFALTGLVGGAAIALLLKLLIWRTARSSQVQIVMAYFAGAILLIIGLISGSASVLIGLPGGIVLLAGPIAAIMRSQARIEADAPHISNLTARLLGLVMIPVTLIGLGMVVFYISVWSETRFEPLACCDGLPSEAEIEGPTFDVVQTMEDMFGDKTDRELDDQLGLWFGVYGAINGALIYWTLKRHDISRGAKTGHPDDTATV